ncbi:hypothetical protein [Hydrocoleum sp. CS-953]|uniref:hypothetical protein n=1 Tax=Microcoleaceae TaxID=1892252 RepID=UPI000B9C32C3|nr:hypothetical protein [Hydrocoleum sp. CS-953]OZH51269.1 hypothetical protein AFK68_32135 [Hydrocoleum sp. CS-953]
MSIRDSFHYPLSIIGVGKLVYYINLNYLGVSSQESGGKKEELKKSRRRKFFGCLNKMGSSIALLSGHGIIPQITNAQLSIINYPLMKE